MKSFESHIFPPDKTIDLGVIDLGGGDHVALHIPKI